MPAITFPNQRVVRIHRERATADFLGIKNENWQAASRDLGAHGLRLYLYLAANANNFNLALSPAAARAAHPAPAMPRSRKSRLRTAKTTRITSRQLPAATARSPLTF